MIDFKKALIILAHAFVGWALCGAIMGIGMSLTSELNAQIIHAVGAPIVFFFVLRGTTTMDSVLNSVASSTFLK